MTVESTVAKIGRSMNKFENMSKVLRLVLRLGHSREKETLEFGYLADGVAAADSGTGSTG